MVSSSIWPQMAMIRQKLHAARIEDVSGATYNALETIRLRPPAPGAKRVAVAVGSRGINGIADIVKRCITYLKRLGFEPFIVPAMGSHGGNTTQGELSVLAGLGITEASMGVPIKASSAVVTVAMLQANIPVVMDEQAAQADHIVVINRVKPHTKFHDVTESGVTKMLTIGLGKGDGARIYHRAAVDQGFAVLRTAAGLILQRYSVLFGLAIVEDGYANTAIICPTLPENWFEQEHHLLDQARGMMPRVPFDGLDILVIDEIGKDISGIGMDSNVTGRHRDLVGDFFEAPHVKRIFVRNLSTNTAGNGNGIGLADVTTQRLVDALDLKRTYANAITAISPEKAAIPIHFATDRECMQTCFDTIGPIEPEAARVVHIKNTSTLDTMAVSRALESEAVSDPNITLVTPWEPMAFEDQENLKGI